MGDGNAVDEERLLQGIHRILVQELKIRCEQLQRGTGLIGDGLQLGSLQLIELVVALEHEFSISLDAEVLVPCNFATAGAVCDLVRRTLAHPTDLQHAATPMASMLGSE